MLNRIYNLLTFPIGLRSFSHRTSKFFLLSHFTYSSRRPFILFLLQERLKKLKAEHGKVQLGNVTTDMVRFFLCILISFNLALYNKDKYFRTGNIVDAY